MLGVVGSVMTPRERRLAGLEEGDPSRGAIERELTIAALGCAALVAVAAFFMVTKVG